jgi:nucleotide-binding universal stress UspA family protein
MFERIVAAIDSDPERSTKVVQAAKELAQACQSEVLIAHVREVERPPAMMAAPARAGAIPPSLHFESEERARSLVDTAVGQLRAAGVSADGRVGAGAGSTARELLDIAASFRSTVIIVGHRGGQVSDLLLGSVAHRIVHLAEVPVLVVR